MLNQGIKWSLYLIVATFFLGCGATKVLVTGKLQKPSGNQMPSPDLPNETPAGVSGFVYFFEPTLVNMGVPTGEVGTFLMTNKKLIAKSLANKEGLFNVKLRPGNYTIMIGRGSDYYSNISNLEGFINPVVIGKKDNKPLVLSADWDAIY
jgi:hypothetical protein